MQKAVLCLLPTLAPVDALALWPDFLNTLLDLLRPELLTAAAPASPDAARARGGGGGGASDVASPGDRYSYIYLVQALAPPEPGVAPDAARVSASDAVSRLVLQE